MQLNILQKIKEEMKEEILKKCKIENLRTNIYLMIITLELNIENNNIEKAYNQEKYLSEIFYRQIFRKKTTFM